MPRSSNRIFFVIDRSLFIVEFSATLLGLIIILFLVYVGIARYFLRIPTPFEEEFSLLIHLWMVSLGMSLVIKGGDHVATTIFYDKLATRSRSYKVLIDLIKIAFIVIMLWFLYQTFPLLTRGVTEYMRWPFAAYYSALIASFVFMLIRYVLVVIQTIR